MRILLLTTIMAVILSFSYSAISFAACPEGPLNTFNCNTLFPNPDPTGVQEGGNLNNITVNMLPDSAIDTLIANGGNGLDAIRTGNGNDTITLTDADIKAQEDGIDPGNGNDIINITGSTVFGRSDTICIGANGIKTISVINSELTGGLVSADVINGSNDADIINIEGSLLSAGASAQSLDLDNGNDEVTITDSKLTGALNIVIQLGSDDDTLTLNNGAEIIGNIRCGPGNDSIIFAMQVPTNDLEDITAEIESKNPALGSIIINDLLYEWQDCEDLVADLEPGLVSPVPTLSQWGLVAMAAILGIIGFIVMRKRQAIN